MELKLLKIAAISDVHSPKYIKEFEESLVQCKEPDLFVLAGDIVNRGKSGEYPRVVKAIERIHGDIPIVACFGNEEYIDSRNEILSLVGNRVKFLDESSTTVSISGSTLGIVGASVILNRTLDLNEIRTVFEKRANRISKLLRDVSRVSDSTLLLLHYSPLDEKQQSLSWWVSKAIEGVNPRLIVHGHIHNSRKNKLVIGTTTVYNVALPSVGSISELIL
ncbi:MAG: metallophosphoesterase family protein [Candidatus Thorarchaeota archaeon]|jgi:Icc-related predicted phosphoesterase